MSAGIRLIIGLGNPGPQYETTRHNAGFWLADHLADDVGARFRLEKGFSAEVAVGRLGTERVIIAKPTTFMNRSGLAAGKLMHFYKLEPAQVLVLHDELDLPPGHVKLKLGGGHAGHNGLRDIQTVLGGAGFWRLRLGIGHPRTLGLAQPVVAFVLNAPRREELEHIVDAIARCRQVLPALVDGDFERATAELHGGNRQDKA
ncbi:MAG: aminoacyl-tRNA hydrolase [Castellaniella sp.]